MDAKARDMIWFSKFVRDEKRQRGRRWSGFKVESAELLDGVIVVKATNTLDEPAQVSDVVVMEIFPQPEERRFLGRFTVRKDRERVPCEWKVSGFNLVPSGEIVKMEVRPSKPLRDGYAYMIWVAREWTRDEESRMIGSSSGSYTLQFDRPMGIAGAYLYKNGRLEDLRAKRE